MVHSISRSPPPPHYLNSDQEQKNSEMITSNAFRRRPQKGHLHFFMLACICLSTTRIHNKLYNIMNTQERGEDVQSCSFALHIGPSQQLTVSFLWLYVLVSPTFDLIEHIASCRSIRLQTELVPLEKGPKSH